MHHEDRAGVNALVRGIDRIAARRLPAAVVMCTNRLAALDPAVRRRAADILRFDRPSLEQRLTLLSDVLGPAGLSSSVIRSIAETTGPRAGREYGFAYSDLVQRLLPALVLDAYPEGPISEERAVAIARAIEPTPPFQDTISG